MGIQLKSRKAQLIRGSYAVYLPKKWAEKNIKSTRLVDIEEMEDTLLVSPKEIEPRENTLYVDLAQVDSYLQDVIIGAYTYGIDKLEIKGDITEAVRKSINETLTFTHEYELMEETPERVVIESLGAIDDFHTLFRRLIRLLNLQYREAMKEAPDLDDIHAREMEIDKFRLATRRAIQKLLENPALSKMYKLKTIDASYYLRVGTDLEHLGDLLEELVTAKNTKEIKRGYEFFEKTADLLLTNDPAALQWIMRNKPEFGHNIKCICYLIARSHLDQHMYKKAVQEVNGSI